MDDFSDYIVEHERKIVDSQGNSVLNGVPCTDPICFEQQKPELR